jgi:hypothetical protein
MTSPHNAPLQPAEFLAQLIAMPNGATTTAEKLLRDFYIWGRADQGDVDQPSPPRLDSSNWSLCTIPFQELRDTWNKDWSPR